MQIGIVSFAAAISDPATGLTLSPVERMHHLLEQIEPADRRSHCLGARQVMFANAEDVQTDSCTKMGLRGRT